MVEFIHKFRAIDGPDPLRYLLIKRDPRRLEKVAPNLQTFMRPGHESLCFSLLLQFTSCGGDLGSSCLDNVVR